MVSSSWIVPVENPTEEQKRVYEGWLDTAFPK